MKIGNNFINSRFDYWQRLENSLLRKNLIKSWHSKYNFFENLMPYENEKYFYFQLHDYYDFGPLGPKRTFKSYPNSYIITYPNSDTIRSDKHWLTETFNRDINFNESHDIEFVKGYISEEDSVFTEVDKLYFKLSDLYIKNKVYDDIMMNNRMNKNVILVKYDNTINYQELLVPHVYPKYLYKIQERVITYNINRDQKS